MVTRLSLETWMQAPLGSQPAHHICAGALCGAGSLYPKG